VPDEGTETRVDLRPRSSRHRIGLDFRTAAEPELYPDQLRIDYEFRESHPVLDSDELRIGRREPFDDQDPEPESNETEKRNCPTDRIRITRSKTTTMMTTISKQTLQKQIDRSVSLQFLWK